MKRNAQDSKDIRWFELPAHMVVHWINAWEEKNEEGDDIIKVYGCQQADVNLDIADEHPFVNDAQQTIAKWTFNLITGKAQMEELIPDLKVEWPIISQDMSGYKNRYAYLSEFPNEMPETEHGIKSVFF